LRVNSVKAHQAVFFSLRGEPFCRTKLPIKPYTNRHFVYTIDYHIVMIKVSKVKALIWTANFAIKAVFVFTLFLLLLVGVIGNASSD